MDNLKKYVEGKTIALVGPAKYLEKSNMGVKIDSYDTVVRLNRGIELVDKIPADVGYRSDILYSCLIEKPANAGTIDLDLLNSWKVKQICCPPQSDKSGLSLETKYHYLVDIKKMAKIDKKIPIRICDATFHTALASKVESRPNTGYLAIFDILRYNPKKLFICGFSFYLDGFVSGVKEGIMGEQNLTEEQFATKCFNSKRHNQYNMWNYAKKTILNNPKVELDQTLEKILSLESFSKALFEEKVYEKN